MRSILVAVMLLASCVIAEAQQAKKIAEMSVASAAVHNPCSVWGVETVFVGIVDVNSCELARRSLVRILFEKSAQ